MVSCDFTYLTLLFYSALPFISAFFVIYVNLQLGQGEIITTMYSFPLMMNYTLFYFYFFVSSTIFYAIGEHYELFLIAV